MKRRAPAGRAYAAIGAGAPALPPRHKDPCAPPLLLVKGRETSFERHAPPLESRLETQNLRHSGRIPTRRRTDAEAAQRAGGGPMRASRRGASDLLEVGVVIVCRHQHGEAQPPPRQVPVLAHGLPRARIRGRHKQVARTTPRPASLRGPHKSTALGWPSQAHNTGPVQRLGILPWAIELDSRFPPPPPPSLPHLIASSKLRLGGGGGAL